MFTGTTTTQTYECGAGCGQTFADLADVFAHTCTSTPEWMTAKGLRAGRPVEAHPTNRADSIDAPERRERTGEKPAPRQAMTNRFPGDCARCGRRVEAGQGHAVKNHAGGRGSSWAVEHKVSECPAIGARETVPEARPVVTTDDVTTWEPGPPMSAARADLVRSLIAERQTAQPMDAEATIAALNTLPDPGAGASLLIDALKDLPRRDPGPTGPAYADNRRANRYPGDCVRCGAHIDAEAGKLVKTDAGWGVDHPAGPCPATVEPEAPAYEPEKGDVHVIDGDFYRIHQGQRSGRFYACRWDGAEWEYAGGALGRCSTETLATADDAARFGELYHCCCYCTRPLDTPESTAVGYGPVCAAKRGLPWGKE